MNEAQPSPVPAVGVVCFRGDDVLLIKRGAPPRQGEWSLPGGRIEFGERAADAALRELREETGCEGEIVGLADVVDGLIGDRHYVLIDYAVRWMSGEPRAGDDAAHAEFISPHKLAQLTMWAETVRVIEAARRLMR
ncbi:MAG: NUDIX hydrolase [Hyphomonadaceae bacterium]|nr:NUDIX hydrolase [Hyphomonadaceae bacterium]MCA8885759.1 NUDIX hydrolase [Hyphomonadaceae bacterium]